MSMGRYGDALAVAVTDNGPGMTPEVQQHIFEQYYQGDASRAMEGHGLGLAIAWRIAAIHQGTIRVHSAPGAGSTFVVELPLEQADAGADLPELTLEAPLASAEAPMETVEQTPPADRAVHIDSQSPAAELVMTAPLADGDWYEACLAELGWVLLREREISRAGQMKVEMTFTPAPGWEESPQRAALLARLEQLLGQRLALGQRMFLRALVIAAAVGVLGACAMAAAWLCYRAGLLPAALLLGAAGLMGVIIPYFLNQYLLDSPSAKSAAEMIALRQQIEDVLQQARALS